LVVASVDLQDNTHRVALLRVASAADRIRPAIIGLVAPVQLVERMAVAAVVADMQSLQIRPIGM
jgi:hypothetical protein